MKASMIGCIMQLIRSYWYSIADSGIQLRIRTAKDFAIEKSDFSMMRGYWPSCAYRGGYTVSIVVEHWLSN